MLKTLVISVSLLVILIFAACNSTTSSGDQAAKPVFEPTGGTYETEVNVTITSSTSEAIIRFTTDGNDPTDTSSIYSTPININEDTTLKARAYLDGYSDSETAVANYIIEESAAETVQTPTFNPPGGYYGMAQTVAIHCPTAGAEIRYTTDGSDPTASSAIYTEPLSLIENTTIKARGFKEDWNQSDIGISVYTIGSGQPEIGEMHFVQGGTFNPTDSYTVTLSSFFIAVYEVTQAEYEAVMGNNPSYFSPHPMRPVESVTWFDAIEYCNRLTLSEGYTPVYSYGIYGSDPDYWPSDWNTSSANQNEIMADWSADGYRLPTEMEYEFAARGGAIAQMQGTFETTYAGSNNIDDVAWYSGNSNIDDGQGGRTHDVGTKAANELTIFDMSGNVYNWVWDRQGLYPSGSHTNPTGAESSLMRISRGGSHYSNESNCTVSFRNYGNIMNTFANIGFRVSRSAF
jgi:formylglycine-generating enzyme required for sulfatase activity